MRIMSGWTVDLADVLIGVVASITAGGETAWRSMCV